jgi:hypothetical protein
MSDDQRATWEISVTVGPNRQTWEVTGGRWDELDELVAEITDLFRRYDLQVLSRTEQSAEAGRPRE